MTVRELHPQDAAAYQSLRLRGLKESPAAYSSSYAQEVGRAPAEFTARVTPAADGSRCVFGAFVDERLAGMLGFVRLPEEKLRHCAELVGMYVAPEFRRRGFGRALMEAAIVHARSVSGVRQLKLSVNATSTEARPLYKSVGFVSFGVEPDAVCVDGRYYDEEWYLLRLL